MSENTTLLPHTPQLHPVYKVQYHLTLQDPSEPTKRYHAGTFVATSPSDGSGYLHHVTGDIVTGMAYQRRAEPKPEDQENCHAKELLGYVHAATYPDTVDAVCAGLTPPGRQKRFCVQAMR